jgi:GT2 family glycosyltransferase
MLSIITSLYRSEQHLETYLANATKVSDELLKEKITHEFLIISNDATKIEKELLVSVKNRNQNFKIIFCPKESLYATWNRGVREASYQIICFWNVDDQRFTGAIIEGMQLLNNCLAIAYFPFIYKRYVKIFNFSILIKKIIVRPPKYSQEIFVRGMHCGPFFMTKKNNFATVGPFDETFKIAGDFDWCVRAAKMNVSFKRGSKIAGIFFNDGTTLSGSRSIIQQEENFRVINK